MNYKNIVFDFGNVIGNFDGWAIMKEFCSNDEDAKYLCNTIYEQWLELDKGTIDYDTYRKEILSVVPDRLKENVKSFFKGWPGCVSLIPETVDFIHELKEQNVPVYLLSNAPTYFADYYKDHELLKLFDGVVFSAPIKLAKPDAAIYDYFFKKFHLKPEECFFIDDLEKNILAANAAGMDGIIFTGDINAVREKIFNK